MIHVVQGRKEELNNHDEMPLYYDFKVWNGEKIVAAVPAR
jgi:hypothetical protein